MRKTVLSAAIAIAAIPTAGLAEEQEIETLVVVSSRISQPIDELNTNVTTLTEKDIEARYQYAISDILRTVPSINVSNSGGIGKNTTVRVRGEEGFRTKLFLDGVELSDPTAPQIGPVFDDLLTSDFDRIEILRGTQGFAYGADAGGVISLRTAQPAQGLSGNLQAEIGRFDSKRTAASIAFANEADFIDVHFNRFNTEGFNAQQSDVSGETDGYENQSVHLRAHKQLGDNAGLQYVMRNNDGETEYDGCFDNLTFAQINACVTESDYQTQKISGYYERDTIRHEVGYSKTEVNRQFFNAGEFGFENKGEIEQYELLGQINGDQHKLVYGAELKKESDLINLTQRDQHGIFVEYLGAPIDELSYSIGVRLDDNDTFGEFTSIRLAGGYEWQLQGEQTLKLKASYGTGFRAPSLFEQAYNDGPFAYGEAAGFALSEEQSEGLDIGVHYQFSEATSITLTFFDQSIENEIIFDAVAFQGYLQTSGNSDSQGVEFEFSHQLNEQVGLWGNYTYNDTETSNGEQRLRRPEDLYNLGIQGNWFDERLSASLFIHGESGAIDIGGTPLDSYVTVNSNVSWEVKENIELLLRVNNIFDEDYQEVVGFNSAGQSASVGIKVTY